MGVEFFECDRCSETICDAGDWWACETCGIRLCQHCEAETDADNCLDEIDQEGTPNPGCLFCMRKDATDLALLVFALQQLGIMREELMKRYQEDGIEKRINQETS